MKITEAMRRKMGLMMIEEMTEDAAISSDQKRRSDALDAVYRIAHTLRAPKCCKNHANWVKTIDSAIRATKPSRKGDKIR